jgi:eukaryotic-like serine/threonine-protein kinase
MYDGSIQAGRGSTARRARTSGATDDDGSQTKPAMRGADQEARPKIRELTAGHVVGGKYRIERQLGAGGMGVVYAATDIQLRRKVAIKAMTPALAADDGSVKRFLREARAVVSLTGEHVVRIFDVGELSNGIPYIAMEFLVGTDLDSLCAERGRLPFREAVDLLLQAMTGLAEAHAVGIVHRDLKPANLFFTRRSDGTALVKVLDFGLAKATEVPLDETNLTATNVVMGTQLYMAPEQLLGRGVDARSDIWALGVCLYQLMTGALPFDAASLVDGRRRPHLVAFGEISRRICKETPRAPHEIVPDIPPGLSSVVAQCLEKDPGRRFANLADLANELAMFASPEFEDIGFRLETVLEGQTLARDVQAARVQLAPDTIPDSAEERTTEKMHRGVLQGALTFALTAMSAALARIRRTIVNVEVPRARSFVNELVHDRRALLIVGVTAFLLTLMIIAAIFLAVVRADTSEPSRGETMPAPMPSSTVSESAQASTPSPASVSANPEPPGAPAPIASTPPPSIVAMPSASTASAVESAPSDPEPAAAANTAQSPARATNPQPSPPHPPPTPATSTHKPNCTPPFVKHPDGKVVWKVECL